MMSAALNSRFRPITTRTPSQPTIESIFHLNFSRVVLALVDCGKWQSRDSRMITALWCAIINNFPHFVWRKLIFLKLNIWLLRPSIGLASHTIFIECRNYTHTKHKHFSINLIEQWTWTWTHVCYYWHCFVVLFVLLLLFFSFTSPNWRDCD